MPVAPTYPGVYIEEIPSGVRTITGVATSITAFIGSALSGPTNEPVTINSYGDFERIFGGLWVDSTLGYAVRDFYLNRGAQAIIVRIHNDRLGTAIEIKIAYGIAEGAVDPKTAENPFEVPIAVDRHWLICRPTKSTANECCYRSCDPCDSTHPTGNLFDVNAWIGWCNWHDQDLQGKRMVVPRLEQNAPVFDFQVSEFGSS